MCGIWASIGGDFTRVVLDSVRRRGPDDEGWFEADTPAGRLRLGHRRLSIYDLSAASAQPMSFGDGRFHVTFNGAIYNYRALRAELAASGVVFRTEGDTEILLAAYGAWGLSAFARFDGMFALALYDRAKMQLLLARDRFGEKPLLLATQFANRAAFAAASDLHQMRQAGAAPWTLEGDVAADFLNIGLVDADERTFVKAVKKAPAGASLVLDLSSPGALAASLSNARWQTFAPIPTPERTADFTETVEALRGALERAVEARLAADVEVGSCLSGGLDSSGVVALSAASLDGRKIKCFSAVFDEVAPDGSSLSERPFVDAAAAAFPHAEVNIITPTGADCARHIDDIIAAQGEPFAHTSICAQWFVIESARREGVKVLLDGQGADELFGGYDGMIGAHLADLVARGDITTWSRTIGDLVNNGAQSETHWRRATFNALVDERLRRTISGARGKWPPQSFLAPHKLPDLVPPADGAPRFDAGVRLLTKARSLPGLLRYEDRNAAWHGMETRLPYLAPGVADLAFRTPAEVKLRGGWTKAVLREALRGVLPATIVDRKRKLGFVSPHDAWMADALKPWAQAQVADASRAWDGLIDGARARKLGEAIGWNNTEANAAAFRLATFASWARGMNVSA